MGEFQPSDLLADGAGERPLFMPKEFAFEQTGRNGSAIEFEKGAGLTPALVVNSAGHYLLSRTRVAQEQHSRIAGGDRFHQFQNLLQRLAASNDVLKIQFAANLFFEIQLFVGKLVFQFGDLAVGKGIFNADCDLARYLSKKLRIVLAERVFFLPSETEYTKSTSAIDQRNNTESFQPFADDDLRRLGTKLRRVKLVHNHRLERFKGSPSNSVVSSNQFLMHESLAVREIKRANPKLSTLRIQQTNGDEIGLHDVSNAP